MAVALSQGSGEQPFFKELPETGPAPAEFDELPREVTSVPTTWLLEEPSDELVCCVCTNVVFDPPNLEVCGQIGLHPTMLIAQRRSAKDCRELIH